MIKVIIMFLLLLSTCYAQDEVLPDFSNDSLVSLNDMLRRIMRKSTVTRAIHFYNSGAQSVATEINGRYYIPETGTIIKVTAYSKTAPVGADLIADVNINNKSIWANTTANKITILNGSNSAEQDEFDFQDVIAGDYITFDVDQIGSGTAGSDLTIQIDIQEKKNTGELICLKLNM